MTLSLAVPGSLNEFDSPVGSTSPIGPGSQSLIVFGLFGPSAEAKDHFFRTICEISPEASLGNVPIRRGMAMISGVQVHILEFPDLYDGSSVRDSDTLLHVGQCLGRYAGGRLRGTVYMRSPDGTDQEHRSMELFKALVGTEALKSSNLVINQKPTHYPRLSQNEQFDDIPGVSLIDASVEAYHCILDQFIHEPPFATLYQQESSPGVVLAKTTVGRLLDSYLVEDERRVACARARLQGKEPETQDPPSVIATTPPRVRQRVESGLTRELEETKQRLRQVEIDYAAAQEQFDTHDESYLALEIGYGQLQLQNERLQRMVEELQSEAELRTDGARIEADSNPPPPPPPPFEFGPTPEEIAILNAEIENLRSDLATAITEKEAAVIETSRISDELVASKKEEAQLKSSNADLEKKASGLEKKVDELQKKSEGLQIKHDALDKKVKELEKERDGLTKENKAANATQTRLKSIEDKLNSTEDELKKSKQELENIQKKQGGIEEERQQAIKISSEILKSNEELKKNVESAKGQADVVQKQAKSKIAELQSTIAAKDSELTDQRSQLAAIASAAEVWATASVEVERLKTCMQTEREQAESRYQAAQEQITRLQHTYDTERGAWDAEKVWGHAELNRLERENAKLGMELGMETMLRDLEVKGYSSRITELEEWAQGRWDAIGSGCIIA